MSTICPVAGSLICRVAPVLVLAGYLVRPFVGSYTDPAAVAEAAAGSPGRWLASSVLIALGFGGIVLAMQWAVAGGPARPTSLVAPLATSAGVVLLAVQLGAVAGATVGAAEAGADPAAVFEGIRDWEGPLIAVVVLALLVGLGTFAHAMAARLVGRDRRLLTAAMALAGIGLLVPSSMGEYLSAASLVIGFWLVAARLEARERGRHGALARD